MSIRLYPLESNSAILSDSNRVSHTLLFMRSQAPMVVSTFTLSSGADHVKLGLTELILRINFRSCSWQAALTAGYVSAVYRWRVSHQASVSTFTADHYISLCCPQLDMFNVEIITTGFCPVKAVLSLRKVCNYLLINLPVC